MKNANVAFCVRKVWAGKFGVIFGRDFGGGKFGVIFWNFIFENFGGARGWGKLVSSSLPPIVEHYGFVLDVQARSEGTGQIFGVAAFVVDGGEALPLAECLGEGCVHGACS